MKILKIIIIIVLSIGFSLSCVKRMAEHCGQLKQVRYIPGGWGNSPGWEIVLEDGFICFAETYDPFDKIIGESVCLEKLNVFGNKRWIIKER